MGGAETKVAEHVNAVVQPVAAAVVNPVAEVIFNPVTEAVINPVVDAVVQPVGEFVVQPIAGDVIKPVVTAVVQPVADVIVKPVINEAVEPVINTVVQPVIDTVVQPVVDTIVQPVIDTIIQPVVQPVIDTIIQPVVQSVNDTIIQPVVQPVIDEVVQPVVDTVVKPVIVTTVQPVVDGIVQPVFEAIIQPVLEAVGQPIIDAILPNSKDVIVERINDPSIGAALELTLAEHEKLKADVIQLKLDLDEFDELDSDNQAIISIKKLHQLARKVPSFHLSGRHIALFGINSTGKSSTINALMGSNATAAGLGESTAQFTAYEGLNYCLYDLPGQNDDVSYFTKEYISLIKGVSHRLVLITATVKQMKKLINLFEALDLHYDIAVNKFDLINFEERPAFRAQIEQEVQIPQWKNLDHVWFISAQHPDQFPDWLQMVHHLTQ
jgi:GTP-binding protein EngB required for normal cell division